MKENELIYLEDGRRVAIDRSVGVVMLCYAKLNNEIYILINERGTKTSEFKLKWNLPSGYLNWDETGEEAAIRETVEETGILIPLELVKEIEHSTLPSENRQNVIFRYAAEVPSDYMDKCLTSQDENEVKNIMWINLNELDTVEWAFNQKETIARMLDKIMESDPQESLKNGRLTLSYYQSSILKEMLFSNKEDAYEFDCALTNYLNNPKAINEFKMAGNYPSLNAMQRAIETNEFQNQLGRESERLILACENMACGNNGINEDDCYRIPLMYIFNKIYKNDN